jgi:protein-disulfide isomerase
MSDGKLTPPVDEGRDHIQGPHDAPVTLVEYGDYECPYCGMAYPIVKSLQRALGNKLRFAFRNFPLSDSHPHAEQAAEAAEAAGAQGKFWEMHDVLYENQERLETEDLMSYGDELGLDTNQVAQALEDGAYKARVREDFRGGVRSGVNGTPTFFINGSRYDGGWNDPDQFLRELRAVADKA